MKRSDGSVQLVVVVMVAASWGGGLCYASGYDDEGVKGVYPLQGKKEKKTDPQQID